MKVTEMNLDQLLERKDMLEKKIKELQWVEEEIEEIEDDQKAICYNPLLLTKKRLARVQLFILIFFSLIYYNSDIILKRRFYYE